jgi:dipeptidyl aminopeptidase/acylaminoacyl peptidase
MYFDADLHVATQRLLLAYQKADESRGLLVRELSGSTIVQIDDPYLDGPRWSPDGQKFVYFGDWRFFVHHSSETQPTRVIELPDYHASFCEWSPSGESLIFSAYPTNRAHPPNIYRYDFDDKVITQITHNTDVDRFPKWNHTGSKIACQRTYRDNGENYNGIVIVDLNTHQEQALPRPDDFSQGITRNSWSPDDQHLIVTEYRKDETRLVVYQLETGEVVWSREETEIFGGCFDPFTGRVLCVTKDALSIYELPSQTAYAQLDLADLAPVKRTLSGPVVTFSPDQETLYFLGTDSRFYRWWIHDTCEAIIEPDIDRHEVTYQRHDYTFRASDGYDLPVQQYRPAKPNGRAIMYVEGGPGEAIDPHDAIVARLLEEGYEVIRPGYRGCGGYGDTHKDANHGLCGVIDVRDVVECGIDWRQRFKKPESPLAVSGFSYGGYLTFLALTHQDAVWTCGITFWGCTMTTPLVQTKGLPADPEERRVALEARSAITQADRIRFPLLILHGDRDTCGHQADQTEEVRQIRDRVRASNIPCELVVFENEGHGLKGCRPQMFAHTFAFLDATMG